MLLSIISIIANIVFFVILNIRFYTDRAYLPDDIVREWQRSPIERLGLSDRNFLLYLQIAMAVVSVVTSILVIAGIKNNAVRIIQLVSSIASLIVFVIIMIVTSFTHAKYA